MYGRVESKTNTVQMIENKTMQYYEHRCQKQKTSRTPMRGHGKKWDPKHSSNKEFIKWQR